MDTITTLEPREERDYFRAHGLERDGGPLAMPGAVDPLELVTREELAAYSAERREPLEFDMVRHVMESGPGDE